MTTLFLSHCAGYRKTDLSPLFYSLHIYFLAEVTQRTRRESKGNCCFLRSDNAISSIHRAGCRKTDLSPLFYYPRLHFRAEARRLRRKRGAEQRGVVTFYRVTTLFLPHTAWDAENRLVTFFLPLAFQISRRGAEWDKEELLLFKE